MVKVLFVCLGNICRSPSAEGIFKTLVERESLTDRIFIDSAGTSAYHAGERADNRMRKAAKQKGYDLTSRSRQLTREDLREFDYILAMDSENYDNILRIDKRGEFKSKVKMMTDFSENYIYQDVPDPYYGGEDGFNNVIEILEESCSGFLDYLNKVED